MSKQSRAETHGIAAKWSGPCPSRGNSIDVGDRIFKLPAKRGFSWVCWTCRWPTAGAEPTIESVRRKLRHRLALHQSIALNKAEVAVLADSFTDGASEQSTAELEVLAAWLRTSVEDGAPANLKLDDARTALLAIDSDRPA